MPVFPHPEIARQSSLPQPHPLWLLVAYGTQAWLLTEGVKAVVRVVHGADFIGEHYIPFNILFFVTQVSLICLALGLLSRYSAAVWSPGQTSAPRSSKSLLLVLPLLSWQLYQAGWWIVRFFAPVAADVEQAEMNWILRDLTTTIEYKGSAVGIILTSLIRVLGGAFEEIIFTGFLANALYKKWGTWVALFLTPLFFTAAHLPKFGLTWHLMIPLWTGLTLVSIRFLSGAMLYPILGHVVINLFGLVPVWIEAYIYFGAQR